MAEITVKELVKKYGSLTVLEELSLSIKDGEFLTLLGPSGCGKSTLLRIIAGLESATGGNVYISGECVNQIRPKDRNIAMVFQSYALYPHLTVRENIMTPLRLRDLNVIERLPLLGRVVPGSRSKVEGLNRLVHETAHALQLDHLLDRKPGQLSGGQRQRVALGRAMVRKPRAFLMDEPLSNLDASLRVHMRAELAELHKTLGTTFVYVTHDQAEALTMSDRIAIMIEGKIIQLGTPDEIYKNPRDKRVAEFIGSPKINMLQGDTDADGNVNLFGKNTGIRIPEKQKKVHLGIRPEHLSMVNGNGGDDSWPFTVVYKENMGSDFYLHGHVNGSKDRIITRAEPDDVSQIEVGAMIKLKPKAGTSMIFNDNNHRIDPVAGE